MEACNPAQCAERILFCGQRFVDMRTLMDMQFISQEKAIKVAVIEMNRRLESMNEFREQLTRQAITFLEVKVYNAEHRALSEKVEALREWKATTEGAKSRSIIISGIAVIVSIATFMFLAVKTFYGP